MDGKKFDDVARRLASSRRTVLKGLAGALAAGLSASIRHSADAQTRQPNGAACTRATQCASLRCSDGVCCDSACMGQCELCASGTCQPVVGPPVGSHPACPGSGPCASGGIIPAGWKVTFLFGPDGPPISSPPCPVVELCLHKFWVFSRSDNATQFLVVAYDEGGAIVGQHTLDGVRYIWKIEVDEQNQTVTFIGQANRTAVMTFAELKAVISP